METHNQVKFAYTHDTIHKLKNTQNVNENHHGTKRTKRIMKVCKWQTKKEDISLTVTHNELALNSSSTKMCNPSS